MTDVEPRRLEEANQAGQRVLIRGGAGHPPPTGRLTEEHGMAFDEGLATRVRELLGGETGLTEMQMFGGLAFLLDGNMACGVRGDDLLVRADPPCTTPTWPRQACGRTTSPAAR